MRNYIHVWIILITVDIIHLYIYIYSIRTLSENMKFIFTIFRNKFCIEFKLILCLPTMYVYCVYPAMSESPKQLSDCLKRAEISVVLIVFDGVLCEFHAYTVNFLTVPQHG